MLATRMSGWATWLGVLLVAACGGDTIEEPPGAACSAAEECPGQDEPCRFRSCQDGACAFEPAEAGTPCGDGRVCDSAGSCVSTGFTWLPLAEEAAPSARDRHTAVWTGERMIVWGGNDGMKRNDGALYDPGTDSWTPTSTDGAPVERQLHTAVWTGSEMIVWGGFGPTDYESSGARYDPATDSWTAMSTDGAPLGRTQHTATWTGSEMIIFGGLNGTTVLSDGARYDPTTDSWSPVSMDGAPAGRLAHSDVWTGDELIIWGGGNTFDWLDTGAHYDPALDSWTMDTPQDGVPGFREGAAHVFTDDQMIIWGGWNGGPYLNDGATYTPGGAWQPIATDGAPSPRIDHAFVWTGGELFVWGGCGNEACTDDYGNGGRFSPSSSGGNWLVVPAQPVLSARRGHTMVWTGTEAIVWGGKSGNTRLGDGARAEL